MTYRLEAKPHPHFPSAEALFGRRTSKHPDFNYNIRLGGTAMHGLVKEYYALLQDMTPDLFLPPAPSQGLHVTIYRFGSEREGVTRRDFNELTKKLIPVLGKIVLPKFVMGRDCYLGRDGLVFDVDPRKPFDEIHEAICDTAGKKFTSPKIRHGTGLYTAGEASEEQLLEINQRLARHPDAVEIEVSHVAALEQWTIKNDETIYYDGEVIEEIPLGNAKPIERTFAPFAENG